MAEERIEVSFGTAGAVKQLDDLNRRVEAIRQKSAGVSFSGAVGAGGAFAGAALGGSATGQAIASFAQSSPLDKILALVELFVRTEFPKTLGKLDVIGKFQGAVGAVSPMLQQAARLGIDVSDRQIGQLLGTAAEGEGRAIDMRNRIIRQAVQSGIAATPKALADAAGEFEGELQSNVVSPWARGLVELKRMTR